MGLLDIFSSNNASEDIGPIELTEVDELQVAYLAENVVKEAVYHVNPEAEAETSSGLEPRYYLKLEIKAALRLFEKNHHLHFGMLNEKQLKNNDQGHHIFDYIHSFLVEMIEPHFEGGRGENNLHIATYIRYMGGAEVAEKFPETIESAFAAYKNNERLETKAASHYVNDKERVEPRLH